MFLVLLQVSLLFVSFLSRPPAYWSTGSILLKDDPDRYTMILLDGLMSLIVPALLDFCKGDEIVVE